jgi:diguanylate cyclase (GGDEF)-like protein
MLPLAMGENWIGRSLDNSLPLADPGVSRHHAMLLLQPDGDASITDQGSTNGTFVNGQRLEPRQSQTLKDGDRIRVGPQHLLKFARPAPVEERCHRELFERSVRDALTGLYNRAYFSDQIGPLIHRNTQRGLGLAVLMLDLDHFKRINDTRGHQAGDAVLREVAAVLRQATRSDDLVARYGGEEFIMALPATGLDAAIDRAEQIRKAIAGRRLRLDRGFIQATASIGVAYADSRRARAPRALISLADLHLYRAKELGRNRVVWQVTAPGASSDGLLTSDGEGGLTREEQIPPLTRELSTSRR